MPGSILAFQDDQPVGFAHAGFGANERQNGLSFDLGVTSILVVRPDARGNRSGRRAVGPMRRVSPAARGRKCFTGAGYSPAKSPCLYLGLYGGSELPGVPDTDAPARQAPNARLSAERADPDDSRVARAGLN